MLKLKNQKALLMLVKSLQGIKLTSMEETNKTTIMITRIINRNLNKNLIVIKVEYPLMTKVSETMIPTVLRWQKEQLIITEVVQKERHLPPIGFSTIRVDNLH